MARKWAWVALAISSMWIAVLFIAVFAPTLEAVSAAGDRTTFPIAGVVAAGVALVATIVVASIGFRDGGTRERELELEHQRQQLERRLADLEARVPAQNETPQPRGRVFLSR